MTDGGSRTCLFGKDIDLCEARQVYTRDFCETLYLGSDCRLIKSMKTS